MERATAALAAGNPLAAIQLVAGRADAHALAVQGIALAQLGEHSEALELLDRAQAAFAAEADSSSRSFAARARAARAEILAATRELGEALAELDAACESLTQEGDERNASWIRLVRARLRVLIGDLPSAEEDVARALAFGQTEPSGRLAAAAHLTRAEAAARRLQAREARAHLEEARRWAERGTLNPLFMAEIQRHERGLEEPVARLLTDQGESSASALDIDSVLGRDVVVDALRHRWLAPGHEEVGLARRGARFDLLLALAKRWPGGATTGELVRELFDCEVDESHRDRLKTTIARLRKDLGPTAEVEASGAGWRLRLAEKSSLAILLPLAGERTSLLEALLWDGAAWSARSLAAAGNMPLRSVQRELGGLVDRGRVRALGGSRSMRYALAEKRLGFGSQPLWVGISGW